MSTASRRDGEILQMISLTHVRIEGFAVGQMGRRWRDVGGRWRIVGGSLAVACWLGIGGA
jgi:hypothetical protein